MWTWKPHGNPIWRCFTKSSARNTLILSSLSIWQKNAVLICQRHQVGNGGQSRQHEQRAGELAAAVMTDSIVRLIPGVLSDEQSALSDCFQDNLLAPPVYTRPAEYKGWKVPDVLLSGNQALIDDWEFQQSMERTKRLRPDLLK